ncbi:MAG: phosphate ABC transporter permease PstA [Halobacteriales archaeon]
MAADLERGYVEKGFGEVSRRVGLVFRYLLLASTLVGIVALAVLLALVTYDAMQPQTADPAWYLLQLVTFVGPSVGTAWWLRRRTPNGLTVGAIGLGIPALGVLFGSGATMLFLEVVPPVAWFAYLLGLTLPLAVIVGLERQRRLPWTGKLLLSVGAFAASIAFVPWAITGLPVLPSDWLILELTLAGPTAAIVGWYANRRWPDGQARRKAAVATLAVTMAAGMAGPFVGLSRTPAVILAVSVLVPAGLYAAVVYKDDPENRPGLVLPLVVVGGFLLAVAAVEVFGVAGPQSWVDWQFLTSNHNNDPTQAGVYPAMVGSIMLMIIVALVSFPLGVGAAVYLEEYAPDNTLTRIIDVNISNLAGVPSVVYGLLGLGLFITYLNAAPGTVFVGGLTLSLLILPIVIISSREAVRSVPDGLRDASYGMGATRWQTIKNVILPEAFPGILTGTILALGRAIGETAPLLVIGAAQVADLPTGLDSRVVAMPLQIFVWATTFAGPEFYQKALPAGVIVLLVILIAMNSAAIVLRNRFEAEA